MDNLDSFDLCMFDFDGLLVNTELIHYEAYRRMFANRGYEMAWDFPRYCMAAHYESTGLREAAYDTIPGLHNHEPDWLILYEEKKQEYKNLVQDGKVQLMPGVEEFLLKIRDSGAKACVVTNSPPDAVGLIREQLPALGIISEWVTREQYDRPKPAPDGYLAAMEKYAEEGDRIVGFEDTIRGVRSLLEAYNQTKHGREKEVVLVSQPELVGLEALQSGYSHPVHRYQTFE
jgi:HAD superfamily hydrolase (TIGR01509 family)